jgi:purine-nucleoside phosphorylase
MPYSYDDYRFSADFIARRLPEGFSPEVLMILGSGLGFLGDTVEAPTFVNYADIPNFKHSTAPGHKGRFVFGTLAGRRVAVMQGRMHCYEGYSFADVTFAVRVCRLLGADRMIVTNAAGAINTSFAPGDIMLITDHIKLFGDSPLTGANIGSFGVRFPDMTRAYSPRLRSAAKSAAAKLGITLREGVYMYFPGPQFETPAEIRAARLLGADAAGMSTVPEVITANHCGMETLGLTLCANMAAGVLDRPLTEQEVLDAAEAAKGHFSALVLACLPSM